MEDIRDIVRLHVCWFFPEFKVVMRHGAEPWTDLAVKLMLKWPNLFYSTSAFAPKYYPKAIIDYANTRGADARAHLQRHATRPLQGRSLAEVPPRKRPPRLLPLTSTRGRAWSVD